VNTLDIIVLGIIGISGLFAFARGFVREALSIAAWISSGLIAVYGFPYARPIARNLIGNPTVADIAAGTALFVVSLVVLTLVTAAVATRVKGSSLSALDRTLGFVFGLARGLIIVVVAFLFFAWLVPDRSQPEWVKNAKSRVVLQGTGQWLISMLPDDPESTILKRFKRQRPDDSEQPQENPAGSRSSLDSPWNTAHLAKR
jgi:membrane protein required for colicin V production